MRLTDSELQEAINNLTAILRTARPGSHTFNYAKANMNLYIDEQNRRGAKSVIPPPAPITIDHAPTCVFNAATVRAIIEAGRIVITVDGIRTLTVTAETIIVEMESRQL